VSPFDSAIILIFALVQWRITAAWLRWASRQHPRRIRAAQIAAIAFNALLVGGYALSESQLVADLKIPGRGPMLMGAATLLYGFGATAIVVGLEVLRFARRHLGGETDLGRRRAINAAGAALIAAPFAVIGYGSLVQRTDLRVREFDLPMPGLPQDLDGLRVLQISDIHLSIFLSDAELARVIDAAAELRPHLAVITGDLISTFGDPLDACIRQLARVKADAGVFGCLGNHERYARAENYAADAAGRVGIDFLRSRNRQLRFGNSVLNLAGVDYQARSEKKAYLRGAERLIVPGAFNVLLSHNPDVFPVAAHQGYNLLLAGHTHGGQVTVEILDQSINPARFFTPFVYGTYRIGAATAYVTRGIGTIGIPARIGAPPEITVMRFRKA